VPMPALLSGVMADRIGTPSALIPSKLSSSTAVWGINGLVPIEGKGGCNALKSMDLIDLKCSSIPTALPIYLLRVAALESVAHHLGHVAGVPAQIS